MKSYYLSRSVDDGIVNGEDPETISGFILAAHRFPVDAGREQTVGGASGVTPSTSQRAKGDVSETEPAVAFVVTKTAIAWIAVKAVLTFVAVMT